MIFPNLKPTKSHAPCDWLLVVDDDEPIGMLLSAAFTSDTLEVVFAREGRAALQVLAERATEPLLVITDVLMPIMDGLTLARKLCARLRHSKIVVMSGHLTDASCWPADLREITFLTKPFRIAELGELVEAARAEARDRR